MLYQRIQFLLHICNTLIRKTNYDPKIVKISESEMQFPRLVIVNVGHANRFFRELKAHKITYLAGIIRLINVCHLETKRSNGNYSRCPNG